MEKPMAVPSEREWLIMEAVWNGPEGITSAEIVQTVSSANQISERTIRVLLNRLTGKGLLLTKRDTADSRVYHYYAAKSKEACLELKRTQFVDSYFHGSASGAVAAFLKDGDFTDAQLKELEALLAEKRKERDA